MSKKVRCGEWFLMSGPAMWDVGEDKQYPLGYFDLNLSNYKLNRLKKKHQGRRISKMRFITIKNCSIKPGFGRGTTTINEKKFKVVYAWAGREAMKSCSRLSYTVRFEPLEKMNLDAFIQNLIIKIYMFEEGPMFIGIKRILTYTFDESNLIDKKFMERT